MIRIIRHRYTGAILHSEEAPSLGAAVEQLVARGESLR